MSTRANGRLPEPGAINPAPCCESPHQHKPLLCWMVEQAAGRFLSGSGYHRVTHRSTILPILTENIPGVDSWGFACHPSHEHPSLIPKPVTQGQLSDLTESAQGMRGCQYLVSQGWAICRTVLPAAACRDMSDGWQTRGSNLPAPVLPGPPSTQ